MYIKIHGTKDLVKGNTQSCRDLVRYLEKENEGLDLAQQEHFFNQTSGTIDPNFAIHSIDNNKKGLKDKDAKFFMLSVNPSERELGHLAKLATGGKKISHISQMNPDELLRYNNYIKDYVREVMDDYAKAFNRGLTGKDLVYYGKLEQKRNFKGNEEQVKSGLAKSGELKPGLQTHVHIVVSRKDISQKLSLSPRANSKGSDKHKLNGKSVKVGFDRDNFFSDCEARFDRTYSYERNYQNSYAYYKFSSNPTKGLVNVSKLASQVVTNPEMAGKNLAISGIDSLTNTRIAGNTSAVFNIAQNPESAKDMLVNQLEQMVNKLVPPQLKVPKKVAENILKPIIELGSGGLDI